MSAAVAAATAQLVAASKAKADPMSQTQKLLSDAAKSVAKATGDLVNAAKVRSRDTYRDRYQLRSLRFACRRSRRTRSAQRQ